MKRSTKHEYAIFIGMNLNRLTAVLTLTSFLFLPVLNAEHPFKISPDLDEAIKAGLNELYNFNFEKSLAIFDAIKDEETEHPMVAFGVASTHWWRISSYVLEADPEESAAFLDSVQNCIKLSEQMIKNGDSTGEGHLVLGGALGLLGRWQATNRQWMSAYFGGKKAYRHLSKALKINPQLKDAYMGKGIFDYFVDTLPAVIRTLVFIGQGGDPKVGLSELEEAANHGIYSKTPSKLFLTQIYTESEKKPEKALEVLNSLRLDHPQSPFIHMMKIIGLYNAHQTEELRRDAFEFKKNVDLKIYSSDFSSEAHFAMALANFKEKKWKEASKYFDMARTSGNDKNPWRTWAALYLGYCYDALEQREEAVQQYKWVLKQLRRWGSHDHAKAHLSRPFKESDPEINKLEI